MLSIGTNLIRLGFTAVLIKKIKQETGPYTALGLTLITLALELPRLKQSVDDYIDYLEN